MLKRLLIGLLLITLPVWGIGQSYNFQSFSVEDGLAQSVVNHITEDKFGNMWFATQGGGLSRYNGLGFKTYTKHDGLPSNEIVRVEADDQGNMWIASVGMITRFDGTDFYPYKLPEGAHPAVRQLKYDSSGKIWFAVKNGVGNIENDSISFFNIEALTDEEIFVTDLVFNASGKVYVSTYRQGLWEFAGDSFVKLTTKNLSQVHIHRIFQSKVVPHYYVVTREHLLKYQLDLDRVDTLLIRASIPEKELWINDLAEDQEGFLWLGSHRGAYKLENGQLKSYKEYQGLTNANIGDVFTDSEGCVWFATYSEGVYQYKGETFRYLNKSHGMSSEVVMSIARDHRQNFWFATMGGGLIKVDGQKITNYNEENGYPSNLVGTCVVDQQGNVWAGTQTTGIVKYNHQKFEVFSPENSPVPYNRIFYSVMDQTGNLWFSTLGGIIKYDGRQFSIFFLEEAFKNEVIWTLLPLADGTMLVGGSLGLKIFDGNGFKPFQGHPLLENGTILAITSPDQDNLYIGVMEEGVVHYNRTSGQFQVINRDDGLASNLIYSLIFTDKGNLMVGTERGIDKVSFHENGQVLLIQNYSANEGFFGIETNQEAVFKDLDGSIWFGSIKGAFKYNPEADKINLTEPATHITNIKLFYEDVNWQNYATSTTNWYHLPNDLQLSYNENHLIFEFISSSLKNPEKVRYQYKLEPFDQNWSPPVDKTEAVYSNIPPGQYTFMVKSCNNDGIWNEEPTRFSFIIVTPFWQTWWFYLGLILLTAGILRLIHVQRVRAKLHRYLAYERIKQEESEKIRKSVARDFQDEMSNHLASISMMVQVLKNRLEPSPHEVSNVLNKLEDYSKELYSNAKDFLWSLEPRSDRFDELMIYIKDLGEEIFDQSDIDFVMSCDTNPEQVINLPTGWSRQIILILKEAFYEYLRQDKSSYLELEVKLLNQGYQIVLKEKGIGIPPHKLKNCDFYKKMLRRVKKINNQLRASSPKRGETELVLEGFLPELVHSNQDRS
ncbi:MAG: ligand-binding sensor domain-containing protein [Candidatus Cyclobacteriaceae bacterium M3_2C_046]